MIFMTTLPITESVPAFKRFHKRSILIALLVVAVVLFATFDVRTLLREALTWIGQLGAWGQVLFVGIYVVATVLVIPGSALGLGAGAMFRSRARLVARFPGFHARRNLCFSVRALPGA
jgi:hypothetical protein